MRELAGCGAVSDRSQTDNHGLWPDTTCNPDHREKLMRGVLLWLVGLPIPIIILLYLFHVI